MKIKLLIAVITIGLLSGCSTKNIDTNKVETGWSVGKALGSAFLSDETKDKLKPTVEATEEVYTDVKDAIKKDVE